MSDHSRREMNNGIINVINVESMLKIIYFCIKSKEAVKPFHLKPIIYISTQDR